MPTIEQAKHWYSEHDPVHGFDHVLRVRLLAIRIARAEGADQEIVEAAVLLHDAQNLEASLGDQAPRQDHHQRSAELAADVLRLRGLDCGANFCRAALHPRSSLSR